MMDNFHRSVKQLACHASSAIAAHVNQQLATLDRQTDKRSKQPYCQIVMPIWQTRPASCFPCTPAHLFFGMNAIIVSGVGQRLRADDLATLSN
jgi:hypothetical protein